jgi:hypothetical protein
MRAMFRDVGHPDVSFPDWQKFLREFSRYVIAVVLDRSDVKLPVCIVPFARGVGLASDALLRKVGHQDGMYRPRGWRKTHCDIFVHDIGFDANGRAQWLTVRQCSNQGLWTIERFSEARLYKSMDEMLVHQFGSTPIMTRSYQSAMRLAMHCHESWLPAGLRWIEACPRNCDMAIEIARARAMAEAHLHGMP